MHLIFIHYIYLMMFFLIKFNYSFVLLFVCLFILFILFIYLFYSYTIILNLIEGLMTRMSAIRHDDSHEGN